MDRTTSKQEFTLSLSKGDGSGVITLTKTLYDLVALKTGHAHTQSLFRQKELKHGGVYVLVDKSQGATLPDVYIGQARNLGRRLNEQKRNIDFTEIAVITTKSNSLSLDYINHLERTLIARAKEANRANVSQRDVQEYNDAILTRSELDEFVVQSEVMLRILGFDYFRAPISDALLDQTDNPEAGVYIINVRDVLAKMKATGEDYVVLSGSLIKGLRENSSVSKRDAQQRQEAVQSNELTEPDGSNYRLLRDVPFSSPSAAARFVLGYSVSGPQYWKRESDGIPLGEVQAQSSYT